MKLTKNKNLYFLNKRNILLSGISLFLILSCGKGKNESITTKELESPMEISADITAEALEKADSVLTGMTLEEKVGQIFMPMIPTNNSKENKSLLKKYVLDNHVGGILLMEGEISSAKEFSDLAHSTKVPLIVAIDAEWGLGMRLKDAPIFPRNAQLGKKGDELIMFDYGREVARECRLLGIDVVLGPVVDITDLHGSFIGARSFGGDPKKVADLGIAYAKGLESGGVMSVAKHFPGHGMIKGDSHFETPVLASDRSQLDSLDLYPFRKYIELGLSGIMAGYISAPALDSTMTPSAFSRPILQDLLREELNFKGLILTDAMNMGGAKGYNSTHALRAGADIIVAPYSVDEAISDIKESLKSGELHPEVIDVHCRRILFNKYLWLILRERKQNSYPSLEEALKSEADSLNIKLLN